MSDVSNFSFVFAVLSRDDACLFVFLKILKMADWVVALLFGVVFVHKMIILLYA